MSTGPVASAPLGSLLSTAEGTSTSLRTAAGTGVIDTNTYHTKKIEHVTTLLEEFKAKASAHEQALVAEKEAKAEQLIAAMHKAKSDTTKKLLVELAKKNEEEKVALL